MFKIENIRWYHLALVVSCFSSGGVAVAQAPDPGLVGLPIVTPAPVVGDVDNNGVVTCRDVAFAGKAIGTRLGQPGYMPRADIDGNGIIDIRDIAAISHRLPLSSVCQGVPTYILVEGHDGSPDPDDNLAQLAGYLVATLNAQRNPRVAWAGMVFGDTTTARRATMLSGSDAVSHANYQFHLLYVIPALVGLGADINRMPDETYQAAWNYTPASRGTITTGAQLIYDYVKSAIDANGMERVVYTAGGGHHAPAEAIALLRHDGYSDDQIFNHFAVVQHSSANSNGFTEPTARDITFPFTIRIDDQNGSLTSTPPRLRSGPNFPPISSNPACTSSNFSIAWHAATVGGAAESGIPNHRASRDASDSGEVSFATRPEWIDFYWNTRNRQASSASPGNVTAGCNSFATQAQCIVYPYYSTPQMEELMNCIPAAPTPGPPAPPGI